MLIAKFVRPELFRLTLGLVTGLIAVGATIIVPLVMEALVNRIEEDGSLESVLIAAGLIAVIGAAEAGLIALRRALVLEPGTRLEANLRKGIFATIQRQPLSDAQKWSSGELLTRLMTDSDEIRQWLAFWFIQLVADFAIVILGVALIASYDWRLGLLWLLVSAPLAVIVYRFQRADTVRARETVARAGHIATFVEESVFGIRTVKALSKVEERQRSYASVLDAGAISEIDRADRRSFFIGAMTLFPNLSVLVCLLASAALVGAGELSAGAAIAVVAAAIVVQPAILSIGLSISKTVDAALSRRRIAQVLDAPVEPKVGRIDAVRQPSEGLELKGIGVAVGTGRERRQILSDVSFRLRLGETIAIVGPTASGKTTLAEIVAGLRPAQEGSILIGGVEVLPSEYPSLRPLIGFVAERPELISGSLRDILTSEDRSATAQQIAEALSIARCDFVESLPNGLDTEVEDLGSLSGGERQRLALARSLIGKSQVLVLDDPLSGLDLDTEYLVEEALRGVLQHKTAIVVARRESTVELASRAVLLEAGRVADFGTHAELVARSALYRQVLGVGHERVEEV